MITEKQQVILDFLGSYLEEYGYPPTVREIASATGVKSTSTVFGHLERLEKKGLIKRDSSKPRAIKLIKWQRSPKWSMRENAFVLNQQ